MDESYYGYLSRYCINTLFLSYFFIFICLFIFSTVFGHRCTRKRFIEKKTIWEEWFVFLNFLVWLSVFHSSFTLFLFIYLFTFVKIQSFANLCGAMLFLLQFMKQSFWCFFLFSLLILIIIILYYIILFVCVNIFFFIKLEFCFSCGEKKSKIHHK
jgi:hypothetical protein